MIAELALMQLAEDHRKVQDHAEPLFPCSAYYTNWNRGAVEGVPWHWHGELEFMLVAEGAAEVEFGGRTARLEAGDGYFCNTRVPHRVRMAEAEHCRVHSLVADGRLLSGGPDTLFEEKYLRPIVGCPAYPGEALYRSEGWQAEALGHIARAHAACRDEAFGYEYRVRYHLSMALAGVLEARAGELAALSGKADVRQARVRAMLACVRERYGERLLLADLAAAAGICEREAQRCFREVLGQTPAAYLEQYRVQMAGQLLAETGQSILEVGLACGFSNPSHFSKVFRRAKGCAPGEYRRRARAAGA